MSARKPRAKYPGNLGKSIAVERWLGQWLSGNEDAYEKWLVGTQAQVLSELMDHYKIPLDWKPEQRWRGLAFCLALDHVPAMRESSTRGRGRPAKVDKPINPSPSRKRGAPPKYDDQFRHDLLDEVRELKEDAAKQRLRLTDAAAVLAITKDAARHQGKGEYRAKSATPRWLKQLQLARKKFAKNSCS
jgi:hypothetical protein